MMTSEQETSINFMRDSDECSIYTSDTTVMTKLDKLVERSENWTLEGVSTLKETGEVVGKTYKTSKKMISFRADTVKRELTDEQKRARREHMEKLNEQRRQKSILMSDLT